MNHAGFQIVSLYSRTQTTGQRASLVYQKNNHHERFPKLRRMTSRFKWELKYNRCSTLRSIVSPKRSAVKPYSSFCYCETDTEAPSC